MALALDTSADLGTTTGTSLTTSYTVSGSNTVLIVFVIGDTASDAITGVTYNGVSMTLLDKVQTPSNRWNYSFFLGNPATGAHNVIVSANASVFIEAAAASYSGASSTVDVHGSQTFTSASSMAESLTTAIDNDWFVGFGWGSGPNSTVSAGANTTLRQSTTFSQGALFDSNGALTPPGSKTMNISFAGAGNNGSTTMVCISPFIAANKKLGTLSMLGVGN